MASEAETTSIRQAMDEAWRDHQHTRDQTWKALQIEFALAVAVVGAAWQTQSTVVVTGAALLVFVVSLCCIQISLRHRNRVELTKFRHILNCEEALGLHPPELISDVKMPQPMTFGDAFHWRKANSAVFILRMHVAIMFFALFILIWRLIGSI
ncbi:MAG: hypothetical protein JSW58_17125 [Candidatus Latescibacterota bacterium]|nr:MAG: hypothetical protein JSW58_17125 [Candidatus Latescibacterota bacterium]